MSRPNRPLFPPVTHQRENGEPRNQPEHNARNEDHGWRHEGHHPNTAPPNAAPAKKRPAMIKTIIMVDFGRFARATRMLSTLPSTDFMVRSIRSLRHSHHASAPAKCAGDPAKCASALAKCASALAKCAGAHDPHVREDAHEPRGRGHGCVPTKSIPPKSTHQHLPS